MSNQALLNAYANTYESVVKLRMATNNRMRCWLRDTIPQEQWGKLDFADEKLNDEKVFEKLPNDQREFVGQIIDFEQAAQKYMKKEVRKHYLWPWLSNVRGIGENLASKLLFKLGDLNRFPTVSYMWSYCGLGGPDWRKSKHNWDLTSISYLIADSFQYQKIGSGGYRDIYDERKAYEASQPSCTKCIEAGFIDHCRPAHINNRARRYTVKIFLKDLWIENKRINGGVDQITPE